MSDEDTEKMGFITHVIIDTKLGTTLSGTTSLPQHVLNQERDKRNYNASSLVTGNYRDTKEIENEMPGIMNPLLDGKQESSTFKKAHHFYYFNCNIYGSPMGSDVEQMTLAYVKEWNQKKDSIDINRLGAELNTLIEELKQRVQKDTDYKDVSEVVVARDELKRANGPEMLKYLRKATPWVLDVAKSIGVGLVVSLLTA